MAEAGPAATAIDRVNAASRNDPGFFGNTWRTRQPTHGQNNLQDFTQRLFQELFYRIALLYARAFPSPMRRLLEFFFFLKAVVVLGVLVYIHISFSRNASTCLDHVLDDWPVDGILRVEILKDDTVVKQNYSLLDSYRKEFPDQDLRDYFPSEIQRAFLPDERNVAEYAFEYGFLRLSPRTRKRLNISVMLVTLDPDQDACFGGRFHRFVLDEFLGYTDILMASVKRLAEHHNNKGYLRNVGSGEQYRFIPVWMPRSSLFTAFFVMIIFTLSVTMLLRFSHHQLFVFIGLFNFETLGIELHFTNLRKFNLLNGQEAAQIFVPAAPMLTLILALLGLESVMSEVFYDQTNTIAFYVILIVWVADQFDALCCHTDISRRYWVRFFFMFHYTFFAYHYQFNGHFSSIALLSAWLFIQWSMLFFFHHYELPAVLRHARVQEAVRAAQRQLDANGGAASTAAATRDGSTANTNDSTTLNNSQTTTAAAGSGPHAAAASSDSSQQLPQSATGQTAQQLTSRADADGATGGHVTGSGRIVELRVDSSRALAELASSGDDVIDDLGELLDEAFLGTPPMFSQPVEQQQVVEGHHCDTPSTGSTAEEGGSRSDSV